MSAWDIYEHRMSLRGNTKRESIYLREKRNLENKMPDTLSFQTLLINGIRQKATVIDTDNLNEKFIMSLPDEDLCNGNLVEWMDNRWLIIERDANSTIYTRAKMMQCNHLLKWVTNDGLIHEQWCIIEDGTKYMSGELEDRNFVTTRGDSRIVMTIERNELTVKFNRESRFLIDDIESPHKLSYILSKPLKLGSTYNNEGVFKFVLQEVTATEDDNHELGIANYYKYFSLNSTDDNFSEINDKKKVWL